MSTQTKLPDLYDDKNLVAALLVLAQSNFDLISAATKSEKVDARKEHEKMINDLFGFS